MSESRSAKRSQTRGEELANSWSHGLGALAAIVGTPFLVFAAASRQDTAGIIAAAVFGLSMIALYGASALYHSAKTDERKRLYKAMDHAAIYLLIAGTYTPFTLGVLRGTTGWMMFGLIWSLALIGVVVKIFYADKRPHLSTVLYVAMGWLALLVIKPLWIAMSPWGLFWMIGGGVAYTLGVVFYVLDTQIRYGHFIWHLFVLAGTAFHFVAVLLYSF